MTLALTFRQQQSALTKTLTASTALHKQYFFSHSDTTFKLKKNWIENAYKKSRMKKTKKLR